MSDPIQPTTSSTAEAELRRVNRALRTISACNHALVQALSETGLLDEICRLIVNLGGYRFVWVGYAERDERKTVQPVAWAGYENGYLTKAKITWADEPHGHGPVGTAIRTSRPSVCRNVHTNPDFAPWREQAMLRGYASMLAVPLRADGDAFGALAIYATEADAFDEGEVKLLGELADDLAYGITALRTRAERERIEDELRYERDLFNNLLNATPDHIYFKDRQSRFIRINDALARRFELRNAADAVGKTDFDMFSAEHARQAYNDEQRIMATGEPVIDLEEKETWPDGRVTWVSSTKVPLRDKHGRINGLVGISRDTTERKNLEAQYRQAQKMEAFGQLAGGVAHDFNNILAAMMMQLSLMQLEPGLTASVAAGLAELARHADRASALTRQLLLFGRRHGMETRTLDLNQVLEDIFKMIRRLLGENIVVELKKAPAPVWIQADAGMVEQVIMNLSVNARDAMPHGGRLTLAVRREEPRPGSTRFMGEALACLAVTDTGCGMDQATKAHLFEPFFTTKPVGKGTGLGLATVYGIVQQHHGRVEVDSAPGKGTTFRVYFPLKAEDETDAADKTAAPLAEKRGGTERVLLVEDDEGVRGIAALSLRRAGYQVTEVPNGVEAIRQWEENSHNFDLLLTDYLMPEGLTGQQLAEQLVRAKASLRVLVMSGYQPDGGSGTPWPAQWGRIIKPFDGGRLLEAVRLVLDRK
jgi:PAS domain S-box-containing protein